MFVKDSPDAPPAPTTELVLLLWLFTINKSVSQSASPVFLRDSLDAPSSLHRTGFLLVTFYCQQVSQSASPVFVRDIPGAPLIPHHWTGSLLAARGDVDRTSGCYIVNLYGKPIVKCYVFNIY